MKQVITIGAEGSMESLQFKGKGVDLRRHGHASIQRISDIVWDEFSQLWTVVPQQGKLAGKTVRCADCVTLHGEGTVGMGKVLFNCELEALPIIAFKEYEQAVEFEVDFIQACKLNGRADLVYNAPNVQG